MMKRSIIIVLLVSLMSTVANGAWYWVGTVDNSWANNNNWHDGTQSPPGSEHSATESIRIPGGTVNADEDDTMGYLMLGRDDGFGAPAPIANATVNINSGYTLNVSTGSSELVSVAFTDGYTNNLNVSNGRLNVWRGTGAGELRLNHIYAATCVGNVTLSGTGIIDTEDLNKGDRAGGGDFTATGGTLVIRNEIDKFGKLSEDLSYGFKLGGATLEIAPIGSAIGENYVGAIGDIEIGNSQDCDFLMDSTSTVVFDLGTAQNKGGTAGVDWDYIGTEGDFVIDGTLLVRYTVAAEVGDYWDVWSVEYDLGSYDGSGSFDSLPSNITASWEDSGVGTHDI
ncbi:MAG: hypothetical protein JSV99_06670, partial [Planctomycetota bacterium]